MALLAHSVPCPSPSARLDSTHPLPRRAPGLSLIWLLLGQKVPVVRQLVGVAGTRGIIIVLGAGLTRGVKQLHELSKAVGNLEGWRGARRPALVSTPRAGPWDGLRSQFRSLTSVGVLFPSC